MNTNSAWAGLEWNECSLLRRGFGSLKNRKLASGPSGRAGLEGNTVNGKFIS